MSPARKMNQLLKLPHQLQVRARELRCAGSINLSCYFKLELLHGNPAAQSFLPDSLGFCL